jgi:hypothetical protein
LAQGPGFVLQTGGAGFSLARSIFRDAGALIRLEEVPSGCGSGILSGAALLLGPSQLISMAAALPGRVFTLALILKKK